MLGKALTTAAAGNAAGEATYVEDVFSTYLYEGNGGTQSIQNNIQLGDDYGGSIYFPLDSYITSTSNINYHNSTDGSFTIEGWIRRKDSTNSKGIFTLGPDPNIPTGIKLLVRPDSGNRWQIFHDGGYFYSANNTIPGINVWTHFAIVKDGTNDILKLYQNGSEIYSKSDTTNYTAQPLKIGFGYSTTYDLVGDISQFEITKEVKYTGTFTAPTAVSTPGSNTELLIASGASPDLDVTGTYTFTKTGSVTPLSTSPFSTVITEGKGGLVWMKGRDASGYHHVLCDTERGTDLYLSTNTTTQDASASNICQFNSNGFIPGNYLYTNYSGKNYVSWTFAKQEKFFDVVTYTGTGLTPQNISHNLGSVPGCIIVKQTDNTNDWWVYHRGADATSPEDYVLKLNGTDARANIVLWNDTAPTDSVFTVYGNGTNATNGNFVAYLFAHNDGDGVFGETGNQDIIKCGSYSTTNVDKEVDLGFEPQWVLIKKTNGASNYEGWNIFDNMRGVATGGNDPILLANESSAEDGTAYNPAYNYLDFTSTGFITKGNTNQTNGVNGEFIYIAIRRGPMKTPESGTEVFAIDSGGNGDSPAFISNFPVDLGIRHPDRDQAGNGFYWSDRIRGNKYIKSDSTAAETTITAGFDQMDGFEDYSALSDAVGWMFRRAPGFFDVVAYEGTGSAQAINHNLGVTPELFIVKQRTGSARPWVVYSQSIGNTGGLYLNATNAEITSSTFWNNTTPTSSSFTVGSNASTGASGEDYIAYLFATVPGVSKVGSYSGDGTDNRTIDCGFSNGARFVIIKPSSGASGDWQVLDTERGFNAGNDPVLKLNTTAAEETVADVIDSNASGFNVNDDGGAGRSTNSGGVDYIFLAIA